MNLEIKVFKLVFKPISMDYNLPDEGERFKAYLGSVVNAMPELRDDGRVPMNSFQLMQRILDLKDIFYKNSSICGNNPDNNEVGYVFHSFAVLNDREFIYPPFKSDPEKACIHTGDAIIYHPFGDILIDLDSVNLRDVSLDAPLTSYGHLLLSRNKDEAFAIYERLRTEQRIIEFTHDELDKIVDDRQNADFSGLTRKEVKSSPIWKAFSRDKRLLDDFVDYFFLDVIGGHNRHLKRRYNMAIPRDGGRAMNISIDRTRAKKIANEIGMPMIGMLSFSPIWLLTQEADIPNSFNVSSNYSIFSPSQENCRIIGLSATNEVTS